MVCRDVSADCSTIHNRVIFILLDVKDLILSGHLEGFLSLTWKLMKIMMMEKVWVRLILLVLLYFIIH